MANAPLTPLEGLSDTSRNKRFIDLLYVLKRQEEVYNDTDFARRVGHAKSYISEVKNGKRTLTEQFVRSIAKAFPSIDPVWLMTGEGSMLRPLEGVPCVIAGDQESYQQAQGMGLDLIPEYSTIYYGGNGVVSDPEHFVAHWSIPQAPKNAYIISMVGNSMSPLLMGGSKLLVKPYRFSSATDIPFGNIFAVVVADEWGDVSTHIKILRRHPTKETTHWIARSVNRAEYDDFDVAVEHVRSLGIVVMDINQHVIL